jgi:hypothetical protein
MRTAEDFLLEAGMQLDIEMDTFNGANIDDEQIPAPVNPDDWPRLAERAVQNAIAYLPR